MNSQRAERLQKKYGGHSAPQNTKKELNIAGPGGRNRGMAMGMTGKPKDMKKTIVRLVRYLAHERVMFIVALCCALIYTAASLAAVSEF